MCFWLRTCYNDGYLSHLRSVGWSFRYPKCLVNGMVKNGFTTFKRRTVANVSDFFAAEMVVFSPRIKLMVDSELYPSSCALPRLGSPFAALPVAAVPAPRRTSLNGSPFENTRKKNPAAAPTLLEASAATPNAGEVMVSTDGVYHSPGAQEKARGSGDGRQKAAQKHPGNGLNGAGEKSEGVGGAKAQKKRGGLVARAYHQWLSWWSGVRCLLTPQAAWSGNPFHVGARSVVTIPPFGTTPSTLAERWRAAHSLKLGHALGRNSFRTHSRQLDGGRKKMEKWINGIIKSKNNKRIM